MHKYIKKSPRIISAFILSLTHAHSMEQSHDSFDDWEIVPHQSSVPDEEEDILLKAQALGNTFVSVLGGVSVTACNIVLNIIENKIQNSSNQFSAGVALGSHAVGNLYGQGLALRDAYENEKNLLKHKEDDNA